MAVRSTMSALIATTRQKIGDPSGASQFFADQDVQDALDRTRLDVQYEVLKPRATLQPGTVLWTDYYSRWEWWESDETLIWGNFTPLTPDTSDELVGHWVFNAGQYPPVFLKGKTYDVWRASADLLEARIGALTLTALDFSTAGKSFRLSQQINNLSMLAKTYRKQARSRSYDVTRSDVQSERADSRRGLIGPVSSEVPFITGP